MREEGKAVIPRFYFRDGSPASEEQIAEENSVLAEAFKGKADGITENELMPITKGVFKFPGFFNKMLWTRIQSKHGSKPKLTQREVMEEFD